MQQAVLPYLEVTGNAVAYNLVDLVARVQGFVQEIDYKDGASVKQGDTLFVIEPTPYQAKLQQAQATAQATQAQVVQSQAEYNRQASLGSNSFASQSVVDQAKATLDSNTANLRNQQAGITLAAINLGYTRVTAPFDGIVTAHLVSVGDLVGTNSPTKLATLVQLDPIYVSFSISEQDVLRIKAAMAKNGLKPSEVGKIPVDVGLMNERGYPHQGVIDYAAPLVDPGTGTLAVRGVLENKDRALLPGMFVRIRIPMEFQKVTALLVPDVAIGADQSGSYVLVVDKDGVVQQHTVKPGQLVGQLRVVESGVAADDEVVVSGNQKAAPGEKVAPQPTTITADAGKS